jgi:hypothetical protein
MNQLITKSSRETHNHALMSAVAVVMISLLILAFNGGIRVGFWNHSVLLPVVRQMLDPSYLPGDFGIALRWYHHRAFMYVIAVTSSLLGENATMLLLGIAGKLFLSFSLFYFCRVLGLTIRGFIVVGLFLALSVLWTGQGLELNTFVDTPTIMPPAFAHGLILLVISSLMKSRPVLAAFLTGLTFLVHMQIGFIFGIVILPFFAVSLRDTTSKGQTTLWMLTAAILPSLPAIWWLAELMKGGLTSSTNSLELIAFRMPHHFEIIAPIRILGLGFHLFCMGAAWCWLRRIDKGGAYKAGFLFWLSITICIGAFLHFLDYYQVHNGSIAKLQFIRLTPCITVFGTACLMLAFETWRKKQKNSPANQFATRVTYSLILLLCIGWSIFRIEKGLVHWGTFQKYSETESDWVEMCVWIRDHGPQGVVYLTPPGEEGFTYLSDRSNIVEFKNNPDGGLFLEDWLTRLRDLSGGKLPDKKGFNNVYPLNHAFALLTEEQLVSLSKKYNVGFAVLPSESAARFEVLHSNGGYRLVRIPALKPGTSLNKKINVIQRLEI